MHMNSKVTNSAGMLIIPTYNFHTYMYVHGTQNSHILFQYVVHAFLHVQFLPSPFTHTHTHTHACTHTQAHTCTHTETHTRVHIQSIQVCRCSCVRTIYTCKYMHRSKYVIHTPYTHVHKYMLAHTYEDSYKSS